MALFEEAPDLRHGVEASPRAALDLAAQLADLVRRRAQRHEGTQRQQLNESPQHPAAIMNLCTYYLLTHPHYPPVLWLYPFPPLFYFPLADAIISNFLFQSEQ